MENILRVNTLMDELNVNFEIEILNSVSGYVVHDETINCGNFNRKLLVKKMACRHQMNRIQILSNELPKQVVAGEFVTSEGRKRRVLVTNDDPFAKDVCYLCLIYVMRQGGDSNEFRKRALNLLKEKYDIFFAQKDALFELKMRKQDMITLEQVAASFPVTTVQYFHQGFGHISIPSEEIFGATKNLPRAWFSPLIAMTIPDFNNRPVAQLFAMYVAQDDARHKKDDRTKLIVLLKYLMNALQSTIVDETLKVQKCLEWKIMDTNGFVEAITDLKEVSKEFIRKRRPDDRNLEQILELPIFS